MDDSGFLQQILRYLGSDHRSPAGELHLQVLAEAAGVVVDGRAGVSKRLDQVVDQQDFLLQRPVVGLKQNAIPRSERRKSGQEMAHKKKKKNHTAICYYPPMKNA